MSLTHSLIAFMGLILAQADAPRASQPLLDKLTAAHSESDAARREDDVWDAWLSESGPTVDIMMERGVTAMQTGDNALARDMFDRIILIDPDYAEVWHRRATLFYAAGRYDEAIADLEEALRREPRHFGAWTGLGVIFEAIEQRKAALKSYREALKIHPYAKIPAQGVKRLTPLVEGRSL
tara:strand:+ start:995 stop:1534 length:540 start_codon:yes stop_codon:yes gene_type:complete